MQAALLGWRGWNLIPDAPFLVRGDPGVKAPLAWQHPVSQATPRAAARPVERRLLPWPQLRAHVMSTCLLHPAGPTTRGWASVLPWLRRFLRRKGSSPARPGGGVSPLLPPSAQARVGDATVSLTPLGLTTGFDLLFKSFLLLIRFLVNLSKIARLWQLDSDAVFREVNNLSPHSFRRSLQCRLFYSLPQIFPSS